MSRITRLFENLVFTQLCSDESALGTCIKDFENMSIRKIYVTLIAQKPDSCTSVEILYVIEASQNTDYVVIQTSSINFQKLEPSHNHYFVRFIFENVPYFFECARGLRTYNTIRSRSGSTVEVVILTNNKVALAAAQASENVSLAMEGRSQKS